MSRVGRKESMRWAAPEQNYDGGDWEDDGLEEIAEEEEATSIKSEDLQVKPEEQDYRDIYEYYNDEEDVKRQSYNKQLEDEIYQRLEPGHSRTTSRDSQVDPELAALYQGTDEFLNRPISIYTDSAEIKPLSLATTESERQIQKILTPVDTSELETPTATKNPDPPVEFLSKLSLGAAGGAAAAAAVGSASSAAPSVAPTQSADTKSLGSSVQSAQSVQSAAKSETSPSAPDSSISDLQKELRAVESELSEPTEAPPPPAPIETPIQSPEPTSVAAAPIELPTKIYEVARTPSNGSRTSFVAKPATAAATATAPAPAPAPALALTAATPEGSDTEQDSREQDSREQPDWQPRWAPTVPRSPEPEDHGFEEEQPIGTDLHESQISLDMSDYSSIVSKPATPQVKGFVDPKPEDSGAESEAESDAESGASSDTASNTRDALDLPSLHSTVSKDESLRSTIGSLENDHSEPELPSVPEMGGDAGAVEADEVSDDAPKSISNKVTRPPVVDLKAVFALDTSAKRLRAMWDLRVKESEYTTQLNTWLESTLAGLDDRTLVYPNGRPPESEGHAVPTSRQVGTAITHSGVKTKETFQKVGKGFNAMKKLMRSQGA